MNQLLINSPLLKNYRSKASFHTLSEANLPQTNMPYLYDRSQFESGAGGYQQIH